MQEDWWLQHGYWWLWNNSDIINFVKCLGFMNKYYYIWKLNVTIQNLLILINLTNCYNFFINISSAQCFVSIADHCNKNKVPVVVTAVILDCSNVCILDTWKYTEVHSFSKSNSSFNSERGQENKNALLLQKKFPTIRQSIFAVPSQLGRLMVSIDGTAEHLNSWAARVLSS